MSGELLSVAPHLISDTVYTVNTDFCLQWLQLLDNHVTATETDAVPLVSHSVTCFTQCHLFHTVSLVSHSATCFTQCHLFHTVSLVSHSATCFTQCHLFHTVPLVSHSVTCFTQCHFTLKPSRHFGLLSPYSRPTLSRKNSMRFLQIIRINR